ncbi:hypothetical protein GXW78_18770 [Roseomonas terrae]|uniref:Uncharacterized protein n=1 Tax=Neoroseomonas terrae TaxID=424799 RepID=A0ABS5EL12_9PROT|nr:hypothetical protein [Neoroseomonas terrae]MBR0651720.1 hypothetical protein [Neoroseomonas terrae]
MALVLAVLAGLLGLLVLVSGCLAVFVARAAHRALEAALADESDDGLRARGVLVVERVKNPALRWIINRRTGAMAGAVAAAVVRDRLDAMRRGGFITIGCGIAAIILAVFLPDMLR